MEQNILTQSAHQLEVIEKALAWMPHVPQGEQASYRRKLINARRELKKIRYALSEDCSTAAFGESQMGKSYLVSALLSTPSHPFSVTDGTHDYNFISDLNPSSPNSQVEATGVITRFTLRADEKCPNGFLRVRLLSVADLVLMLCEAYYHQVMQDGSHSLSAALIDERMTQIANMASSAEVNPLINEDDLLDIQEYLKTPAIQQQCTRVHDSHLFDLLLTHINSLSHEQTIEALTLLWDEDANITRLLRDLLSLYAQLDYSQTVYAHFDSVLKRKGSLLDVARLDEMYNPEPENQPAAYTPTLTVNLPSGKSLEVRKSFFSALIAELDFVLPAALASTRPFLSKLDILDFPGARRPEQISQSELGMAKKISTALRRGKVTYLFNKYSAAKRISSLLFCHNNSQSAESTMGNVLNAWVRQNVGATDIERDTFTQRAGIPPLFVVCTWFNKDLDYNDERPHESDLSDRWNRRFNIVLQKEVISSTEKPDHWFNKWSRTQPAFQNLYMLRDFKYSRGIYQGYDPELHTSEQGSPVSPAAFPDYFEQVHQSFLTHPFVKQHFAAPDLAWHEAADCAKDGTSLIIDGLNRISQQMVEARNTKFATDLKQTTQQVRALLESYYHSDDASEQIKKAKRQAGAACMQLDRLIGRDSYAFGHVKDALSISEADLYELIHSQLLGEEQAVPMTDEETSIFMSAGMNSSLSREENVELLCAYLGVDSEEECQDMLEGIDINSLLSRSCMQADRAESLMLTIEAYWHDKVLSERAMHQLEDALPAIANIITTLWTTYTQLDIHQQLTEKVRTYLQRVGQDTAVGIIADFLTMELNRFTLTFGTDFLSPEAYNHLCAKAAELRVVPNLLPPETNAPKGLELLTLLSEQKRVLASNSFNAKDRAMLAQNPQFGSVWRWQNNLRLAFLQASDVPDYDLQANDALGKILEVR